jgi:hypothetical protein
MTGTRQWLGRWVWVADENGKRHKGTNHGAYWRIVAARALSSTLALTDQTPAKIKQGLAMFVAAAALAVGLALTTALTDKLGWVLIAVAGAVTVFVGVLAYQMIVTPALIWHEHTEQIATLKKTTAAREEKVNHLKALEVLCDHGRELNERPLVDDAWCQEAEAWDFAVQAALTAHFDDAAYGYRSMPPFMPRPDAADRFSGGMDFVESRVTKLRLIIMRLHDELREMAPAKAATA